jgi:hypothetical protein
VPETIKEAEECVNQEDGAITWQAGEGGYKYAESLFILSGQKPVEGKRSAPD